MKSNFLIVILFVAITAVFGVSATILIPDTCTQECADGTCTVTCSSGLTASCTCKNLTVIGVGVLEVPECDCYGIGVPTRADLQRTSVILTVTPAQLANIEAFKQKMLSNGQPKPVAKRIAEDLSIIQLALKNNNVDVYLSTLNKLFDDAEFLEGSSQ